MSKLKFKPNKNQQEKTEDLANLSFHKCMLLTNVALFKKEIKKLSISTRFIAKKHHYNKEIIAQQQISLLSA